MEYKIERTLEAIYQPYAECVDERCGREWPMGHATRDNAKHHVRTTGHTVRIVIEKVAIWGPRRGGE